MEFSSRSNLPSCSSSVYQDARESQFPRKEILIDRIYKDRDGDRDRDRGVDPGLAEDRGWWWDVARVVKG